MKIFKKKVEFCYECPHCVTSPNKIYCKLSRRKIKESKSNIHDFPGIYTIPDWCSLEDWDE